MLAVDFDAFCQKSDEALQIIPKLSLFASTYDFMQTVRNCFTLIDPNMMSLLLTPTYLVIKTATTEPSSTSTALNIRCDVPIVVALVLPPPSGRQRSSKHAGDICTYTSYASCLALAAGWIEICHS